MIKEFPTLRDDEIEILLNAPVMVAVLIAGADDNIDSKEVKSAITFSGKKKNTEGKLLAEYFEAVGNNFKELQESYIKDLPEELEVRQATITSYLRQLNGIFPKIDLEVSVKIYQFLLELAKSVAIASGGVMGFNKISKEEAAYLKLEMIQNPVDNRYQ